MPHDDYGPRMSLHDLGFKSPRTPTDPVLEVVDGFISREGIKGLFAGNGGSDAYMAHRDAAGWEPPTAS